MNENNSNLILKCQRCGKPIGAFTPQEVAYEIGNIMSYSSVRRRYEFLCDECKYFSETMKQKQYTFKEIDAIVDIIKGLNLIKPNGDEIEAMKITSRRSIQNEPMSIVFELYKNELMIIKTDSK